MRRLICQAVFAATLALSATLPAQAVAKHKLMVLSVDGLDWRYIRDRAKLGLKIPNIVRLLGKSQWADGVVGVWPTVTWPSHTAIITGERPDQHGILNNARGTLDPALSYWSADQAESADLVAMRRRGRAYHRGGDLAGDDGSQDHLESSRSVRAPQWRLDGPGQCRQICHAGAGGRDRPGLSVLFAAMGG